MTNAGAFVGRALDWAVLEDCMRTPGQATVISGDAGIGKSRLVAEVAASMRRIGSTVLVAHCLPLSQDAPLLPLIDVIRGLRDLRGGEVWAQIISASPASVKKGISRLLPEAEEVVESSESIGGHEETRSSSGDWERVQLLQSVESLFAIAARQRPIVLVVEDAHWADEATIDVLSYLITSSREAAASIVLTFRNNDAGWGLGSTWLERLQQTPKISLLELKPLDLCESTAQMRALVGASITDERASQIFLRSEGNPFYTEQLVRSVLEPGTAPHSSIPSRLAEVLSARTEGVQSYSRRVMSCLAVAGASVGTQVLCEATHLEKQQVRNALRDLARRHLLRLPFDVEGRDLGHQLAHALLAEAVRANLLPDERQEWHERLGDSLAGHATPDTAEVVAEHYRACGHPAKELVWRRQAALRAGQLFASAEACTHWLRAVDLLDQEPGVTLPDGATSAQVYAAAAGALKRHGSVGRAAEMVAKGLAVAPSSIDPSTRASLLASLGHHRTLDDLLAGQKALAEAVAIYESLPPEGGYLDAVYDLWFYSAASGQALPIVAVLDRALSVAQQVGTPMQRLKLHAAHMCADASSGDSSSALAHLNAGQELMPANEDPETPLYWAIQRTDTLLNLGRLVDVYPAAAAALTTWTGGNRAETEMSSFLRANVFLSLALLGDLETAQKVLSPIAEVPDSNEVWHARAARAALQMLQGDAEESARSWVALPPLAHPVAACETEPWRLELFLWEGEPDHAFGAAALLVEGLAAAGDTRLAGRLLLVLARAVADLADRGEGAPSYGDDAVRLRAQLAEDPLAAGPMRPFADAYALCWQAELARASGIFRAQQWAEVADVSESHGLLPQSGYARWRQAEAELMMNGRGHAVSEAVQQASHLSKGHVPLRRAVERLAKRARVDLAAAPKAVVAARAFGLTDRELIILSHLAQGQTNRQIASVLYLSTKTVDVHVRHILQKFDVSNRLQAVVRADQAGLL